MSFDRAGTADDDSTMLDSIDSPTGPGRTDPEPGRRRLGEGFLVAVAAVLGAALVLAVLVVVTTRGNGSDTSLAGERSETAGEPDGGSQDGAVPRPDEPAVSDPTGTTPCPGGERSEVCEAVAFIEDFKGMPFVRFPTVNFIDDAAFDEFILDDFDAESSELDAVGDSLRALGLIDTDVDLADALRTSLEIGVVGGYNTETEELNVRGTDVNLYTRSVMVHELTHAWDDQHHELSRPELDEDDESASGFLQIVEGSAVLVEQAWRETLTDAERAELERLELGAVAPEDLVVLFQIPSFILQTQISPYVDGAAFVSSVYDDGGIAAVDALFADPPVTTEQVLHPEAYAAREAPADVPAPEVGDGAVGEPIDQGTIGELALDLWLGQDAGDGWGGDAYVTWRTEDGVCSAVNLIGDTDDDTDDILAAGRSWADEARGRSAQRVAGVVRLLGCV